MATRSLTHPSFPAVAAVDLSAEQMLAVIAHLARSSVWFAVEPNPDELYTVYVKPEYKHMLPTGAVPAHSGLPSYAAVVDALGKMIPLAAEAVTDRQATLEMVAEDGALVSLMAEELTVARELYEQAFSATH